MSTAAIPLSADAAAPKGKKKLLVILVAVLALLAAAGGGAAWFFHQKAASADHKEDDTARKDSGKPPVFTTLEAFTVNLTGGDHFLQLGVVLQLKNEETAEKVKTYLPQIRNGVLLLLSSKTAEELEAPAGKAALIDAILKTTRAPFGAQGEDVQAVLLGSMLVQ